MATLPREAMQQAAQARMQPQLGVVQGGQGQGQNAAGQVAGLLDQAKTLALQPQNFQTAGPVLTDFSRNWLVTMIQLAKQKGATAGPAAPAPGQAMSPSPAPMQPGAPAMQPPTPAGIR